MIPTQAQEGLAAWIALGLLVVAIAIRLTRDTPGRLTLLGTFTLFTAVGLVITPFVALLLFTWCATTGLLFGAGLGPERPWGLRQRVVLLGTAIGIACAALEGLFRLPFFERRFGSPAEEAAWERRYDRVAGPSAP